MFKKQQTNETIEQWSETVISQTYSICRHLTFWREIDCILVSNLIAQNKPDTLYNIDRRQICTVTLCLSVNFNLADSGKLVTTIGNNEFHSNKSIK